MKRGKGREPSNRKERREELGGVDIEGGKVSGNQETQLKRNWTRGSQIKTKNSWQNLFLGGEGPRDLLSENVFAYDKRNPPRMETLM